MTDPGARSEDAREPADSGGRSSIAANAPVVRRLHAEGLLFAGADSGGRLRRPVDALLVVAAAVLFVIASVLADAVEQDEPDAVEAARTLWGWFDTGWRVAYAALMGFGLIVVVAIASSG